MGKKTYDTLIVLCGSNVYRYDFKDTILLGMDSPNALGRKFKAKEEDSEQYRQKTIKRNQRLIKQIIECNHINQSKLLTITHKANITDLDYSHYEFMKFIQRLNYNLKRKLKYLAVIEYQKRGSIHYHIIIFNLAEKLDLDKMRTLWTHGSINVKRITNEKGISHYISSYFDITDNRLLQRKMYLCSKGLNRPII